MTRSSSLLGVPHAQHPPVWDSGSYTRKVDCVDAQKGAVKTSCEDGV